MYEITDCLKVMYTRLSKEQCMNILDITEGRFYELLDKKTRYVDHRYQISTEQDEKPTPYKERIPYEIMAEWDRMRIQLRKECGYGEEQ